MDFFQRRSIGKVGWMLTGCVEEDLKCPKIKTLASNRTEKTSWRHFHFLIKMSLPSTFMIFQLRLRIEYELERKRNYGKFTTFASDCDKMIIGNHLRLFSICEHHLLPFYGEVL